MPMKLPYDIPNVEVNERKQPCLLAPIIYGVIIIL